MNGCGSKVFGVLRRFIPAAEAFGAHNNRGKYFRSQLFSALNGLAGAPPLVFKGGAFLFRPSLRKIPTVFSKHQITDSAAQKCCRAVPPKKSAPKRKTREPAQRSLANRSKYCRAYQLSRKPNSIVRLPPSNANLLRNVGEVTKMYPAFKGLAFCVESILPLLVGRPMLGLR